MPLNDNTVMVRSGFRVGNVRDRESQSGLVSVDVDRFPCKHYLKKNPFYDTHFTLVIINPS